MGEGGREENVPDEDLEVAPTPRQGHYPQGVEGRESKEGRRRRRRGRDLHPTPSTFKDTLPT